MIRKSLLATAFLFIVITYCWAASLDGKWTGSVGDGFGITLNLKVAGEKLTGTITTEMGENPISDGKVKGNEFSFNAGRDGEPIPMKGKIDGDKMEVLVNYQGQDYPGALTRAN
ncbi:hypothetical protein [Adhaeribacter aquaticus]|uniref:hypothetical protein n=1 Tax=Adhaeribacter aquaticus TaxID=299567 RepID=UPI00047C780E|nr:hypothetical protein [Adhaeribacter aquaticus]